MKERFKEKFENAILSYPGKHGFRFIKAIKTIARIVEDSISSRKYGEIPPQMKNELTAALETCKEYEIDCDAVRNLASYVFKAEDSSIFTYDCPKRRNFQDIIGKHLNDLPKKGAVYIAWRTNPLSVYYVGKTKVWWRRLKPSRNASLSVAIEKGALFFTMIFPDKSNNIGKVEGSFIRMIKKLGKGDDMLNEKNESFNRWHRDLSKLEKFFNEMRNKVRPYNR